MYGLRYGPKLRNPLRIEKQQEWVVEMPKESNARQLRGIHFIDPNDEEHQETMKNARKKLETPMAPAMPCKKMNRDGFLETGT